MATSDLSLDTLEYGKWPLEEPIRAKLIERIGANLSALAFFSDKVGEVDEASASSHAERIERSAFSTAEKVHADGGDAIAAYAKVASGLMLEVIKQSVTATQAIPEGKTFDISGGKREFVTKEAAEELFKPLLEPDADYVKVVLSNRSFGREAAGVVAKALQALKGKLLEVDLSDIIAGRPEAEALEVLTEICGSLEGHNLLAVNLSDNALGEKGVRACAALLKSQGGLQKLYFCNNGISVEAAQTITEFLPSSKSLQVLHFHNNMSGDGGAMALASVVAGSSALEDFRFSSTRVATEGGVALAEALGKGTCLLRLDMRDNMFGPAGGLAIAKSLSVQYNLKEVYLSDAGLGDKGAAAVAEALEVGSPNLEVLDLASNEMTPQSAIALAMCIARKPRLTRLLLSENELGDQGVYIVCRALHENPGTLQELDLGCNDVGANGAAAAAGAVADKPNFKVLNLNSNHISVEGIAQVQDILRAGVAGLAVLAPLDDNDEEADESEAGDEDEDKEDEDGKEAEKEDGLSEQLKALHVAES